MSASDKVHGEVIGLSTRISHELGLNPGGIDDDTLDSWVIEL